MTDSPTKDLDVFNDIDQLDYDDVSARVASGSGMRCITVCVRDPQGLLFADEARKLRDWLNKVLP